MLWTYTQIGPAIPETIYRAYFITTMTHMFGMIFGSPNGSVSEWVKVDSPDMREQILIDIYIVYSLHLPLRSPGQVLQHLPGNEMGSSHLAGGHSFFILRHCTRATMRRFLGIWKGIKRVYIKLVMHFEYSRILKET